jgi:CO dehydrogenase/acetyl-CoA synthase alpha subunit
MNEALDGQPVALRGRVPVKVQGAIRKGDLLVTGTIPGVAVSVGRASNYGQAVFAKALENKTTAEVGVIEAVII